MVCWFVGTAETVQLHRAALPHCNQGHTQTTTADTREPNMMFEDQLNKFDTVGWPFQRCCLHSIRCSTCDPSFGCSPLRQEEPLSFLHQPQVPHLGSHTDDPSSCMKHCPWLSSNSGREEQWAHVLDRWCPSVWNFRLVGNHHSGLKLLQSCASPPRHNLSPVLLPKDTYLDDNDTLSIHDPHAFDVFGWTSQPFHECRTSVSCGLSTPYIVDRNWGSLNVEFNIVRMSNLSWPSQLGFLHSISGPNHKEEKCHHSWLVDLLQMHQSPKCIVSSDLQAGFQNNWYLGVDRTAGAFFTLCWTSQFNCRSDVCVPHTSKAPHGLDPLRSSTHCVHCKEVVMTGCWISQYPFLRIEFAIPRVPCDQLSKTHINGLALSLLYIAVQLWDDKLGLILTSQPVDVFDVSWRWFPGFCIFHPTRGEKFLTSRVMKIGLKEMIANKIRGPDFGPLIFWAYISWIISNTPFGAPWLLTIEGERLRAHVLDRWCPLVWNPLLVKFPIFLTNACFYSEHLIMCPTHSGYVSRVVFFHGMAFPIGEAKNPGPMNEQSEQPLFPLDAGRLIVGTINPTQVFGKEDIICSLGQGIWTCSETSHTTTSRPISHRRLGNMDLKTIWSCDNEPLNPARGTIRGKAAGTCVISHLPMVPSHHNLPTDVWKSCRYCETVVQINHDTKLLVISLYGPTYNGTHVNPEGIIFTLMGHAVERGSSFQGPVVIAGDFNTTLDKIPPATVALGRGWKDLHVHSSEVLGHELEPTCKTARHSFILGNPAVVTAVRSCRTLETFDFATHPILFAELDFSTLTEACIQWWLPKSIDCVYLDQTLMEEAAGKFLHPIKDKIQDALTKGDTEEAFQMFISSYEQAACASAVDCSGFSIPLPKACLGKGYALPFRCRPVTMPTNRTGRLGDVQPFQLQQGVQLRRILKQVRRLHSLENQVKACNSHTTDAAQFQCQDLWVSILKATGFPGGFKQWILLNGEGFVPYQCPHLSYIASIKEKLHQEYKTRSMHAFLAQRQRRRIMVQEDIVQGGRRMFQEIRGSTSPSLSQVAYHSELKVAKQRWPKHGHTIIRLEPSQSVTEFVVGETVIFQNQKVQLVSITDDTIVVDKALRLRNYHEFTIWQKHRTAVRSIMQGEAAKAWNVFWQRDKDTCADTWEDCLPLLTGPSNCPSLPFEEFQFDKWLEVVRKIPNRSSRGACGFTKRELLDLSPSFVTTLFQFFAAFEAGHPWPQRWAIAKVVCLNKVEIPDSALDCRPITVLSRLYRCWSSYRSKQILAHLASIIPPNVSGTCGIMSADMLVGLTLAEIENADEGHSKFGCVLDLKKCYNLIPRVPMCIMLAALRIPIEYIQGFANMLCCMQRSFIIAGGAGNLHHSFTGIAEGCSFSVACMCALSYFASLQLETIPATLPVFFADNWSAITETLDALRQSLDKLDVFATSLRMVFSAAKSWVWSSGKSISKAFKNLQIQGETIPIRNCAVDLGCDATYRGRHSKVAANKRFCKAKDLLRSIQRKKLPTKFRGTAIKLAGHGSALYGSELSYTTPHKWHTLRSQTAGAMNQGTCGVSPWLLLSCSDPTLDPQYRCLIRRIKFWRRFFRVFPHHKSAFLKKVCNYSIRSTGPAISFRKSFADVDWTCLPDGWMRHSSGLQLKWDECSRAWMHQVLSQAWTRQVSESTQHRKYMDISGFDVTWHNKIMKQLSNRDHAIMAAYVSGKHITNDFLTKFIEGIGKICPFCDEEDSRHHALFRCKENQSIRSKYHDCIQWARKQSEAVAHFGLCPWNDTFVLKRMHKKNPDMPFTIPPVMETRMCIFTDGSAFFVNHWDLTLASGAYFVMEEGSFTQHSCKGDMVPGVDHSSYRGEVCAVLFTLNDFWHVKIHTDCQAVVDIGNQMVAAKQVGTRSFNCEHWDIWRHIWQHICIRPVGFVTFCKVAAHKDISLFQVGSWEAWAVFWNNRVDLLAKDVILNTNKKLFQEAKFEHKKREETHDRMHQLWLCFIDIAHHKFEHLPKTTAQQAQECVMVNEDSFVDLLPTPCCHIRPIVIAPAVLAACPYTAEYAELVLSWANQVLWPPIPCRDDRYTSLLELYVDCYLTVMQPVPVQLIPKAQRTWGSQMSYALRSNSLEADTATHELATQSRTWTRIIRWLFQHAETFRSQEVHTVHSLKRFGYRLQHASIPGRPQLVHNMKAAVLLSNYFNTSHGKRVNLKGCFTISAGGG